MPFSIVCVCVCVIIIIIIYFFLGGREGASPVQVKDSILLIHGSLEESSPYRTGVYIKYLLRIQERHCSSMQRRKEDKLQHLMNLALVYTSFFSCPF